MLQPKKAKYRKQQRGRLKGRALSGNEVVFGDFGLKALESAWITARQIEAARRAIVHHARRGGKVWIRIFPDKPITARPPETRMGGGKGAVDHWAVAVRREKILLEVGGVEEEMAKEALRLASHKLPIATEIVTRQVEKS